MTILARYSSVCPECDQRWQPGDLIRADEDQRWKHVVCPDEPTAARTGRQCPTCHLTMPLSGVCDECGDQ